MNLLLDAHVLLWALHAPDRLGPEARRAIEDPGNAVFYSAAAVWELELKAAKGKLTLPPGWLAAAHEAGMEELPIPAADCVASAQLPWHHHDPFDRLIVAQAMERRWRLVSRDSVFQHYDVRLLEA